MDRKSFILTKIIATLGPASSSPLIIRQLLEEGVRIFRINFSHGTFSEYESLVYNIRKAEEETGIFAALMGDLSGPKIRLGKVISKGIVVKEEEEVTFVKTEVVTGEEGYERTFSSNYPQFIEEVKPGEIILLDDGNVRLKCETLIGEGDKKQLVCKVITGGKLSTAKGINLPESDLSTPALTDKDHRCIDFAVKMKFDYLALSFVREAADVLILKKKLRQMGARSADIPEIPGDLGFSEIPDGHEDFIPVIAKIEKPQAIRNLEAVVRESDAVMVARGDLGVEMDLADVAVLQKKIIHMCQQYGKPVIVATQMLQSMIESKTPTRAEVSDVANAIFDGVDAVMLSGETAVGKYPLETVKMMKTISVNTSKYINERQGQNEWMSRKVDLGDHPVAIAHGVKTIADNIHPRMLAVWTNRGVSAVFLSQRRMPVPILAFSEFKSRLRKLSLLYGVKPIYLETPESGSAFIRALDEILQKEGWALENEPIIILSSDPIHRKGIANRIVVHHVGEGQ